MLRLTDGTVTVTLSGDGAAILGCTYVPRPPGSGQVRVTDDATVILEGTTAQIVAATQALERLFAVAQDAPPDNHLLWVEFQREGDAEIWRSQVHQGRLLWSEDPLLRRLTADISAVSVVATWERDAWWETADEVDAGTVHILNGDVAGGVGIGDWIGMAGPPTYSAALGAAEGDNAYNAGEWTNIEGVLPTPVHLRITNDSGSSIATKRVWVANDVYARFDGAQHQLAGAGSVSWTGASAHTTARWAIAPTAAQIAKMVAAGGVRLLAVMASVSAGVYLRAQLQQVTPGPTVTTAWTGPEALTVSGRFVYDLGYVQMPPGVTTFDGWYLVISIYAAATGAGNLDFVQMCPGRELVVLDCPGLTWADDAVLDWWGDERYAAINSYHASLAATGRLMLQPERPNRLQVLVESSTGVDVNDALIVQVKYRPRRATI